MRYRRIFYVLEQPALLNVSEELANDDAKSVSQGLVLDGKAAAADGDDRAASNSEGLFRGPRLIEHLEDGGHAMVGGKRAVLLELQLLTSLSGEVCPGDPKVIDGSTYAQH